MKGATSDKEMDIRAAYLFGRFEKEIESFAHSIRVSPVSLAERVAKLLLGEGTGTEYHVPGVRTTATANRKTVGKVEVAVRTSGKPSKVPHGQGLSSRKGQKSYWGSKTPEEREAIIAKRMKTRETNAINAIGTSE